MTSKRLAVLTAIAAYRDEFPKKPLVWNAIARVTGVCEVEQTTDWLIAMGFLDAEEKRPTWGGKRFMDRAKATVTAKGWDRLWREGVGSTPTPPEEVKCG